MCARKKLSPCLYRGLLTLLLCSLYLYASAVAAQKTAPLLGRPDVRAFIADMVSKHGFDEKRLNALFAKAGMRDDIIKKITRPAEKSKPWRDYRKIFLDQRRINDGVAFWRQHAADLERAERDFGVPPQIILAILGVETRFGRITGNDGVLEALATIAFGYPRRADFFRSELEHFLLLTRAENIAPLSLKGSYAGAMGLAQFMPSSYRAYAVDFDGDGLRDLWQNPTDAIGSIGNYLAEHRWQRGGPIAMPAHVKGGDRNARKLVTDGLKTDRNVARLRQQGVTPSRTVADNVDALLLRLDGRRGAEYWIGFNNFYVITRYNRSSLYAMAVHQLAQEIRRRYEQG